MKNNKFFEKIKKKIISEKLKNYNSFLFLNQEHLKSNTEVIIKKCKRAQISPVIKSDGYGIGAKNLLTLYTKQGLDSFFVGNIDEAIKTRKNFKNIKIFVLNCGIKLNLTLLEKYKLVPVLNNINQVIYFSKKNTSNLPCIIHIDTGMNRLGLNHEDLIKQKNKIKFKNLKILYLMTHLACAEQKNNKMNTIQLNTLKKSQKYLQAECKRKIKISISNSSGIWLGNKFQLDLVRPGAAFLGVNPIPNKQNPLKNVLYLFAYIIQIKTGYPGSSVGYGASYKLKRKTKLAIISIGYGNGFLRSIAAQGKVYINNKAAKIVGRISMDLTVIDITNFNDIDVKVGDPVEIFGFNKTLEQFAKENNTIEYEIICSIGRYANIISIK